MLHHSFESRLPELRVVFERHKIKNAYVFGSVLTENFNQNSDIDILINFLDYTDPLKVGQSIWDLEDDLENLLEKKIDLLTERSLKNIYFIRELNQTKKLIYEYQA